MDLHLPCGARLCKSGLPLSYGAFLGRIPPFAIDKDSRLLVASHGKDNHSIAEKKH